MREDHRMKSIRTASALVAALLAPASLVAQDVFEGTVAYSAQINGMSIDMVHHVKGKKVRMEMAVPGMGEMIVLMDMDKKEMNTIMPTQQAYMTMNLDQAMAMAGQQGAAAMQGPEPEITRTGQMETVAGHRCENVVIEAEGNAINMCVATDIGYYFMGGSSGGRGGMAGSPAAGMSEAMQEQIRELFGSGFFPLRMTMSQGSQSVSLVATSIEKKSISDDLFTIPEGYTKMGGSGGGI